MRVLAYLWFHCVMVATCWWPDFKQCMRLRGFLLRPALRRAGRDFQVGRNVSLLFSHRLEVGEHVYIATGCWLHAVSGITIEDEVQLAPYVVLVAGDHGLREGSYRHASARHAPIRICRGAWLAAHTTVLRGVTIGRAAVLAANAVATHDIPDFAVAAGVPARVIRMNVPPDGAAAATAPASGAAGAS